MLHFVNVIMIDVLQFFKSWDMIYLFHFHDVKVFVANLYFIL
jgi:hypothetical protein